jgi:hypothetical protein
MKILQFIKKVTKYGAYVYAAIEVLEFAHKTFEKIIAEHDADSK